MQPFLALVVLNLLKIYWRYWLLYHDLRLCNLHFFHNFFCFFDLCFFFNFILIFSKFYLLLKLFFIYILFIHYFFILINFRFALRYFGAIILKWGFVAKRLKLVRLTLIIWSFQIESNFLMHIVRKLLYLITISCMLILFDLLFIILKFKLLILILIVINIVFPTYLSVVLPYIYLNILVIALWIRSHRICLFLNECNLLGLDETFLIWIYMDALNYLLAFFFNLSVLRWLLDWNIV